jgi:pimeloyl-ACP methyl ester carboxylesterase
MRDHHFDGIGLKLHAVTHGDPGAAPLVLLHGFMDHAHAWDFVARELAGRFYCIALDFRGFGDSGWSADGYLFPHYQLDVAALWAHFKLDRAFVAGHSMGGNVGSQWAGLYPQRVARLVLAEGFGPPDRGIDDGPHRTQGWVEGLLANAGTHPRSMLSIGEAAARLEENHPFLTPERAAYLAPYATRATAGGLQWKFDPVHRLPSPHPYREDEFMVYWRRIAAPVLAVHGAESGIGHEVIAPRYRHIRDLHEATVAGAGHSLHIEQPEALAQVIAEFLER